MKLRELFRLNRWLRKLQAAPVQEIRLLRLEPDDVIIVQMHKRVTADHAARLKKEFEYYLNIAKLKNKVWVLEKGIELKVMRGADHTAPVSQPLERTRIDHAINKLDDLQLKIKELQEAETGAAPDSPAPAPSPEGQ